MREVNYCARDAKLRYAPNKNDVRALSGISFPKQAMNFTHKLSCSENS